MSINKGKLSFGMIGVWYVQDEKSLFLRLNVLAYCQTVIGRLLIMINGNTLLQSRIAHINHLNIHKCLLDVHLSVLVFGYTKAGSAG